MKPLSFIVFSLIAFLISLLAFPVQIKLLKQWKIFDSSGQHKIHSSFTPSMGGVSIFAGVLFSLILVLTQDEFHKLKFFFISLALMFVIGLRDDILALSARQKLYSQFLPVFILVFLEGTILNSTYGLLSDLSFPFWLSVIVTIFVFIILTNAYNLIDGLDGLAGSIGLLILIQYGVWFFLIGDNSTSLISFLFAGSLLAFLIFNWQPSKIFMGDTGALLIGFLISYLTIKFININHQLPADSNWKFASSVSTAICVVVIPVFDTLRVIILRLRKGQSPFKADKNHLHHQFLNLGYSHSKSVGFILAISIIFSLLALLLRDYGDILILSLVIAGCLAINFALKRMQSAN